MAKYFEKTATGKLLIDPIEANHKGLTVLTEEEFRAKLEVKNASNTSRPAEIEAELTAIDIAKIRPMSALMTDPTNEIEVGYLTDYQSQAETLRSELETLAS